MGAQAPREPAGLVQAVPRGLAWSQQSSLCQGRYPEPCPTSVSLSLPRTSRATWRTDRDMGLMNAIGLQPRNPTTSVTSQGTQTLALQLQNAETQTEREIQEPGTAASGPGEGKSHVMLEEKYDWRWAVGTIITPPEGSWPLHMDRWCWRECHSVTCLGSAFRVAGTSFS